MSLAKKRKAPEPRAVTVRHLLAYTKDLSPDAVVLFEMPNGVNVSVRSIRHGLAPPSPIVSILGMEHTVQRQALVLKG